jgi:putative zinc finger/helix-turn-helix YgiT family protein
MTESKEVYIYRECGLENVFLYHLSFIKDEKGEDIVYIPKINQLHKMIAKAILFKTGKITPAEIRFLRTEMGLKQSEFSEILGKEAQAVGRWERGEVTIDDSIDLLIRFITKEYYNFDENVNVGDFSQWVKEEPIDSININVKKDGYELMSAA